jgi:hypothetical protein
MHDNDHVAQPGGDAGAYTPIFADTQPILTGERDLRGDDLPQRLKVEFTGSGSEYFRIWIVNLLLTIVTLSLYRPFAKARRLAYFHATPSSAASRWAFMATHGRCCAATC